MTAPVPTAPRNLVDEVFGLQPTTRIVFGTAIAAIGVVVAVSWFDSSLAAWSSAFALVVGVAAVASGIVGVRHERSMQAEAERAMGQWEQLRRELEGARERHEGVGKALTRLGYHHHEVRSWIRAELGIDDPASAKQRLDEAALRRGNDPAR